MITKDKSDETELSFEVDAYAESDNDDNDDPIDYEEEDLVDDALNHPPDMRTFIEGDDPNLWVISDENTLVTEESVLDEDIIDYGFARDDYTHSLHSSSIIDSHFYHINLISLLFTFLTTAFESIMSNGKFNALASIKLTAKYFDMQACILASVSH
jgi:hypothetical protein